MSTAEPCIVLCHAYAEEIQNWSCFKMRLEIKNRWVYAAVGVLILLIAGMTYAWSVFSTSIMQEYPEWNTSRLSLTFTLVMIWFCLGCLSAGFLLKKIRAKIFVWIAAGFYLIGFFLSANTASLAGLYIGFGVICGFAAGLAYSSVMGTVSQWFPDRPGLISGILLMGFGISSFITGKLFQFWTLNYIGAWRQSFVVLGVVSAVVLGFCGLFLERPESGNQSFGKNEKRGRVNPVFMEVTPAVMIKQPTFWLFYIWSIMVSAAGLALVSQAAGIAREIGRDASPGTIATVVGLISIFNGTGRVVSGNLYDHLGRSTVMHLVNGLFLLTGITLMIALKSQIFALLVVGFLVGGLAYGGITPTCSAFISSYYGLKNYPQNFPLITTNLLISSFGSAIAGTLYDLSNSYLSTYLMICVLAAVGILASLGISVADRRSMKRLAH